MTTSNAARLRTPGDDDDVIVAEQDSLTEGSVRGGFVNGDDITVLLGAAKRGDRAATEKLFSRVYAELKTLARANRRRWSGNETLNTTALIHEVFIKFSGGAAPDFDNRTHFYATASRAMRQILTNYARAQNAAKRGGDAVQVELKDVHLSTSATVEELLAVDDLLIALEKEDPRRCRVVECRVFGGMTVAETAAALSISNATVKRDWQLASVQLFRKLEAYDRS